MSRRARRPLRHVFAALRRAVHLVSVYAPPVFCTDTRTRPRQPTASRPPLCALLLPSPAALRHAALRSVPSCVDAGMSNFFCGPGTLPALHLEVPPLATAELVLPNHCEPQQRLLGKSFSSAGFLVSVPSPMWFPS